MKRNRFSFAVHIRRNDHRRRGFGQFPQRGQCFLGQGILAGHIGYFVRVPFVLDVLVNPLVEGARNVLHMAETGSYGMTWAQYAFYFGCFGTAFDDDEGVGWGHFGLWGW